MNQNKEFKPGFRINLRDIIFIILGLILAYYCHYSFMDLTIIILSSICHFFMFCNVFRISRIPELIWASLFILLSYLTINTDLLKWTVSIPTAFLIAGILIFLETNKESYHGILWRKFNPNLQKWWNQNNENT